MKDVLPESVYSGIRTHLIERATKAVDGWQSASDEEDALTGDFGAHLRTNWSPLIADNGDAWRWKVNYKKFRGRGARAFEKESGADGIIQIEVSKGLEKHVKGLLFQAKKIGNLNGQLQSQIERMERIASGGSAVIEYGPEMYRGISGKNYLEQRTGSPEQRKVQLQPLPDFLGDNFLPCTTGTRGMYYDAVRVHGKSGVRSCNPTTLLSPDVVRQHSRIVHID